TQEITIYRTIEAVADAPQRAVTLAGNGVAAQPAVHTHRRRRLQIPLARIVPLQCLIGKNAGRTNLHEVAAELAFENSVLIAPEVDLIAQHQCIQVPTASIITIKPRAAIALNAAIHLMVNQRAEVLVMKRAFAAMVAAVNMTIHHGHILQMTFAA